MTQFSFRHRIKAIISLIFITGYYVINSDAVLRNYLMGIYKNVTRMCTHKVYNSIRNRIYYTGRKKKDIEATYLRETNCGPAGEHTTAKSKAKQVMHDFL